ncbi:MAG: copper amine oxidase [Ruminococcaceae bacterium]|nr:copper amine oxidase [Oscillospiraceae bacterium]
MKQQTRKQRMAVRIFSAILSCVMLIGGMLIGASAAEVTFPSNATATRVFVDGKEVLAGECIILDSTTYVPLRKFCNLFASCDISWNGKTNTATVRTADLSMTVKSDAAYITANGHVFYTVGKVRNLNGHLYVPIRPLARAFAEEVTWNGALRSVELRSVGSTRAVKWANYNEDEVYWLSRIISAEAKGEPFEGQIAVGNVVLNRVRHKDYPNTIYGVIFDRKHGTQFSPVSYGTIYQKPTESAVLAAKICLEGYSISDTAIFFLNPRIATNNWIVKNRPYAFSIGNHDFYN